MAKYINMYICIYIYIFLLVEAGSYTFILALLVEGGGEKETQCLRV
jgi:hypothetical protein